MGRVVWAFGALLVGCMPPSVRVVDEFLVGYSEQDSARMLASVVSEDQPWLQKALTASTTSALTLSLPPRPLSYELVEIESKDETLGRHVILTHLVLKNPLAFTSKQVGQNLGAFPETREKRHRFLSVRQGDQWRVKLDLEVVIKRAQFVETFEAYLARGQLVQAEAMLKDVPPPPDDPNAQKSADRLLEALTERLRARTSTAAQPKNQPQ